MADWFADCLEENFHNIRPKYRQQYGNFISAKGNIHTPYRLFIMSISLISSQWINCQYPYLLILIGTQTHIYTRFKVALTLC